MTQNTKNSERCSDCGHSKDVHGKGGHICGGLACLLGSSFSTCKGYKQSGVTHQ